MAEKVIGPTGSQRRRWLFLCFLVAALGASAFVIAGAQANPPEQAGYFELDKDLINNQQPQSSNVGTVAVPNLVALGTLGGNINASVTSFTVCQAVALNPPTSVATPITIQIDAERMTVGAIASASGGGCSGAFKRTYSSVTRGVPGGSAAASHGASGVSGYVTLLTFNTVTGDDWNQVKDAVDANNLLPAADRATNPCSTFTGSNWTGNTDAKACDFIVDPPGQTVFSTGGSKDDLDINIGTPPAPLTPSWRYTNQAVPDADDIQDGYAIKYQAAAAGSHQFLYFGADRTAVNGAKDMGFWFFKGPVGLNPDGTFSGQHQVGDLLLLGTFTNGGAATTIRIFKWVGLNNPTDPADTNGVLKSGGNFGDCVPGGSSDGCNTVNNSTIKSPWAYQSKISGTPANTIYAGGMMEGGVDLTSLKLEGCFSSFLAETRSSPEVGAQLKDFLLGSFEACSSGLTTTPQDAGDPPADLTDHSDPANGIPDVSIGTGSVQVTDSADLEVTGSGGTFTGTLSFHICGPIASGTCDTGGVAAGSQTVTANGPYSSDPVTLTSVGRYCWRGDFDSGTTGVPDASDSSTGECFEVLPVTPTLTTSAGDDVVLGNEITDTATLSGTANQPGDDGGSDPGQPGNTYPSINATNGALADGSITWTLDGPDNCTDAGLTLTGSPADVSGDNTYGPVSATPTAIGTYTWVASYDGSSPNTLGAGPSSCPPTATDGDEEVTVTGTASLSTAQDWLPNDTATLTGDAPLNGTVTFQLYTGDNCGVTSGGTVDGQFYSVDVGPDAASGSTFSTSNTTSFVEADSGSYSWLVTYTDDNLQSPDPKCETTTITIDDTP